MKVYIVETGNGHEGGSSVKVFLKSNKAEKFAIKLMEERIKHWNDNVLSLSTRVGEELATYKVEKYEVSDLFMFLKSDETCDWVAIKQMEVE